MFFLNMSKIPNIFNATETSFSDVLKKYRYTNLSSTKPKYSHDGNPSLPSIDIVPKQISKYTSRRDRAVSTLQYSTLYYL